jgi:hypothetical protein
MKALSGILGLLLLTTGSAAEMPPPPPPEAGQFDFWLGEWEVHTPDGKKAGDSRIERVGGGWGLLETWTGTGGGSGRSLNTWLPKLRQWRQFWVGNGGALELTGGLNAEGAMVLEGTSEGEGGTKVIERITWTRRADGSVRQHWEQSTDGGATWTTAFDGLYRRKSG